MILEEIDRRLQKMELLTRINSMMITDEQGNRRILLRVNEEDLKFVDDKVSPDEYTDRLAFLQKIIQKNSLAKSRVRK